LTQNSRNAGKEADHSLQHPRLSSPAIPHTFHIPVMGTGFTIDTPLKVARYGISSVVTIGDDILIEQMRKFHSEKNGIEYKEIPAKSDDARARRIAAYLNLLNTLVEKQIEEVRAESFSPGSDLTRYFEMLPDAPLKKKYLKMLEMGESKEKTKLQDTLRGFVVPGNIDVNIMTKVDGDRYCDGVKMPPEEAVAMSALRGFANSRLRSSLVLSAGLNRRLFGYIANFDDFFPEEHGIIKKKLILKVSDFRSALIQGKMLTALGLWVSEYRIESGVNCGGHAFTAKGYLMGPILEEFKRQKQELIEQLFTRYRKALTRRGLHLNQPAPRMRVTVQGGIGTVEEDRFLLKHYNVDGTGWGTPFLLVPEATNVDDDHLKKLAQASKRDVYLSDSSPLGVPFWNLRTSDSEKTRLARIQADKPGSPCPKGFLGFDTEFGDIPACLASRRYQKNKLKSLATEKSSNLLTEQKKNVLIKTCLCLDLAAGVLRKTGIDSGAQTAVCCGPSIADFNRIVSLDKMIDHIYGRLSLLKEGDRPHMFIREISLYIDYMKQELEKSSIGIIDRSAKYFSEFKRNLNDGIAYYRTLADNFGKKQRKRFLQELEDLTDEINRILSDSSTVFAIEGAA